MASSSLLWSKPLESVRSTWVVAPSLTFLSLTVIGYIALRALEPSSPAAANVLFKLGLFREYFVYFLLSHDKSYKAEAPSGKETEVHRKKILFIRHGESTWNEIFNKGFGPGFLLRLLQGIFLEIKLLPTLDSIFIDSSLSDEGIGQVLQLRHFLSGEQAPVVLKSSSGSVLVTSNLRRAIETAILGFQDRFASSGERIEILSCLQEMSRNVDANTLAPRGKIPDLGLVSREISLKEFDAAKTLNTKENYGNKTLKSNGLVRMADFNEWAMKRQKADTVVIAVGHSLWFRNYFRAYLPGGVDHIGRTKKMANCGIVGFDLVESDTGKFAIDPESIQVIFRGFQGASGTKSA